MEISVKAVLKELKWLKKFDKLLEIFWLIIQTEKWRYLKLVLLRPYLIE